MRKLYRPFLALFIFNFFILDLATSQINLEVGLVAFYPFVGNALDESVNDNHASEIQGAVLGEGCDGEDPSAYYLNGVDSYIEFPNSDLINFEISDAFAISMWLNIPEEQLDLNGTVNDIIVKWSNNGDVPYPYILRYHNSGHEKHGRISFARYDSNLPGCGGSSIIFSAVTLNDNTWHNVIVQRNPDGIFDLYVDGISNGSFLDNSICSVQNNSNLLLGSRLTNPPFRVFKGGVDNLRIYNRLLSDEEIEFINNKSLNPITENENNQKPKVYPNPVKNGFIAISNIAEEEIIQIDLNDLSGKLIKRFPSISPIELPEISAGMYILTIQLSNTIYTEKIFVTR